MLGWCGALRRDEISKLTWGDVEDDEHGIVLNIRRSKGDQTGVGAKIPVPYHDEVENCPVKTLSQWGELTSREASVPIFRRIRAGDNLDDKNKNGLSGKSINDIVKTAVSAVGWNPDSYSAHSLRSGFATQAAIVGAQSRDIMAHTRHKNLKTLLGYIRDGRLFSDDNPLYLIYRD
jgi:integrase